MPRPPTSTGQLQIAESLGRAVSLHKHGEHALAAREARRILEKDPRNAQAMHVLGSALLSVAQFEEARKHLLRASELMPDAGVILYELAVANQHLGRFEDAFRSIDRGLALEPGNPRLLRARAEILVFQGRAQEAYDFLKPMLTDQKQAVSLVLAFARACQSLKRPEEAVDALRIHAARTDLPVTLASDLWFRLGSCLDRMGEFDEAFEAYSRGNAIVPSRWEPDVHTQAVDALMAAWSPEALRTIPRSRHDSRQPVLIVGMMRSGTSLVEQILSGHPEVFGCGELNDIPFTARRLMGLEKGLPLMIEPGRITRQNIEQESASYLSTLSRLGKRAKRVTDKLPINFLHLGLVGRLVPGARVIHCIRDPMDTGLSNYFTHFAGHHPWSYDLEHIGRYHFDYERLMAHWKAALELPILDVVYEELVRDVEGQTRRMLEFLDLPFDARCLSFHESERVTFTASNDQVRRPLYSSSVQRWRKYEKHLEPLRRGILGPAAGRA